MLRFVLRGPLSGPPLKGRNILQSEWLLSGNGLSIEHKISKRLGRGRGSGGVWRQGGKGEEKT